MLLRDVCDAYMQQYSGRDTTRVQRVAYWVERLGGVSIGDVIDDDVNDALDELAARRGAYFAGKDINGAAILRAKTKPMTGATVNRYAAALSSVCTWAQKRRLTPRNWTNPVKLAEKRPESSGRLRFLDRAEIDRLLTACKAQRWPRLYLIVLFALASGCRRGELEGLRWRDLDLAAGLASLATTKNGEPRQVPLTDPVIAELRRFEDKPDALVFPSKQRPDVAFNFTAQWHQAMKDAGVRGVVFHTLRHTAASHMVMSGASLHETGQVLGHKTVSMTARYSHLSVQHKVDLVRRSLGSFGAQP